MTAFRRTAGVAALCIVLMLNAGCQGDGEAQPLPPADSSTNPSESSSPNPSEPAWQDKYSQQQIDAYEAALDRFEIYEQRSEPIWRRGKATPAAEELFREFFASPAWMRAYSTLETYEQSEVKTAGTPDVLWSRAGEIRATTYVLVRQCVDHTVQTTTQYGKEVRPRKKFQRPVIREIQLSKPKGFDWLIYRLDDIQDGDAKPCGHSN